MKNIVGIQRRGMKDMDIGGVLGLNKRKEKSYFTQSGKNVGLSNK